MRHIYEDAEAVEQLANIDLAEKMDRREQVNTLCNTIDNIDDPLLRHILHKIVELMQ